MAQKLKWLFVAEDQTFSVDPNCEDYGKYGMLSFALTRCKDVMTYEEFLTVQSLYNVLCLFSKQRLFCAF